MTIKISLLGAIQQFGANLFFEALKRLEGDQGGRQILSDYPAHIQHMHWPDRYVFADVDDPDSFGHVSQYLDKKIRSMGEKK